MFRIEGPLKTNTHSSAYILYSSLFLFGISSKKFKTFKPDIMIILAWHLFDTIHKKWKAKLKKTKFVKILPEFNFHKNSEIKVFKNIFDSSAIGRIKESFYTRFSYLHSTARLFRSLFS